MRVSRKIKVIIGSTLIGVSSLYYIIHNTVKNDLINIMKQHEEIFEIKYSEVPKIAYKIQFSKGEYHTDGSRTIAPYNIDKHKIEILFYKVFNRKKRVGLLSHEVGHGYANELSDILGRGNWPVYPEEKKEQIGITLVSQGIAETFERAITNQKDEFKDEDWPEKIEDFYVRNVTYNGGNH